MLANVDEVADGGNLHVVGPMLAPVYSVVDSTLRN